MTLFHVNGSGPDGQHMAMLDGKYLIDPQPLPFILQHVGLIDPPSSHAPTELPHPLHLQFRPAVAVSVETHEDGAKNLRSKMLKFLADTEFEPQFLGVLILAIPRGAAYPSSFWTSIISVLEEFRCSSVFFFSTRTFVNFPEGPYFTKDYCLYRTWRLFPDVYEAFQLPTIHEAKSDKFKAVTLMCDGKLMVPVPSRLHFQRTQQKPLNGMRVTVKDIIDLKGVKTTGQSRSFEKLYGPCTETAAIVTGLVELGAVIVGKTKCTQFAPSDQPTADWVDYNCPWNPRGDGYLSPRGSSTGTCVAIAGYDWVDVGIGSDTGGSIRGPASVMGLFALRPSQDPKNMDKILPIIRNIDTPGVVCRNAELFHELSVCLFKTQTLSVPLRPTKLLYPVDYWSQWPKNPIKDAMEVSVAKLESLLGIKRSVINLADRWLEDDPAGNALPLRSYLQDTFMNLLWKGYYDHFLSFRRDFESKYGYPPYVHPVIQYCWKCGSQVSAADEEVAQQQKAVYSKWLRASVPGGDGFNTIMVFPFGDLTPLYRDEYRKAPDDRPGSCGRTLREDHQASLAGIPCIVVPVDQVSQPSKVTGGTQLLPVAVSLMSGVGECFIEADKIVDT
ncbi:amidase signature domain-containing protein [Ilyonectria sp. MPI-CAGE-AT-0026]|nr:amidase signature domain-containing protein [Ilyonectria sp. MPI-CAGE-AT-0026]